MPSALAAAELANTPSAARSVWASPLYRGATLALFLSGLGTSATGGIAVLGRSRFAAR